MRLRDELKESKEKLIWMPPKNRETTRLNYKVGNLHHDIRKWTSIANQGYLVFYCSNCGERFNTTQERIEHVNNHE